MRKVMICLVMFPLLLFGHQLIMVGRAFASNNAYISEDTQYIYAGNQHLELTFQKGDGELYGIRDKATGTEFIKEKNAYWSLYDFMYAEGGQQKYVGGWIANSFSYSKRTLTDGVALELSWNGFTVESRRLDMSVSATIEVKNDSPLTYWSIAITNNENIAIEAVDFPAINGIGQISQDPLNDYLVYPSLSGLLFQDPVHNFKKNMGWGWGQYYPSWWGNMQFISYYSSETQAGLYLASNDTQGYNKFFNIGRPDPWLTLGIRYPLSFSSENSVHVPYSAILGVFSGDWYTASQIYRKWAIDQWWCNKGTIYQRSDTPLLFKEIAAMLIILTHLRTINVVNDGTIPEIVKAATDYLNMPALVSWWGWEKDGWYENYPEVFPPYGGWELFDDNVNGMLKNQGHFFSCICTDFYSMDIPSWDTAKDYAVKNRNGEYIVYKMTPPLVTTYALMDPSTKFFQDTIMNLTMTLVNHGVDFFWMDGFPVFPPALCYDASHGHPIGGGNWWYLGYRQMFENIRDQAKKVNPNFAMGAEGMAEVYLPYFDSFYDPTITGISPNSFAAALNDINKVQYIPLWDTVYHDYLISYSTHAFINPESSKSSKGLNTWGMGMNLIRGKILKLWSGGKNSFQNDPDTADYYKRAVQARFTYANEFLIYGQMMKSPNINTPSILIDGAEQIPYTMANYPPFSSPSVLTSAWKSPSGDVGYIFTNINDGTVTFPLTISPAEILLPSTGYYSVVQNRNGSQTTRLTNVHLPQTLSIEINPLDVLLIQVAPYVFPDIPVDYWAKSHVIAIYNRGITTGCALDDPGTPQDERRYCPEDNVTREQMAAFITRALNQVPPDGYCGTTNPFPDVAYDRWSCKNIKRLYELGITTGYGDGRFGPDDNVTRAQMAAFLSRAFLEMK